jgi:serine/threonine protein kinase
VEPLEVDDPGQVGRYELVARLGYGAMGRVYLARSSSGELFALNMIHQFLSDDPQFRQGFRREVTAAQRVTGSNTAALVAADPDGRPPWMAVEYVEGPSLGELIDDGGPLDLAGSRRLAAGIAQALISIHDAGLIHRDLKPSNVLMAEDGPRLIDFGIAHATGAGAITTVASATDSAGFMSPELARAEDATQASDVFALGAVLCFAATGRRPFGDGSISSVTERVAHEAPDLTGVHDDGLRELIGDCLEKDPQRRPTPREVLQRCPGLLDNSRRPGRSASSAPLRPRRGGRSPRPGRPIRKTALAPAAAGALVLVAGIGAGLALGSGGGPSPAAPAAVPAPPTSSPTSSAEAIGDSPVIRPTGLEAPKRPSPPKASPTPSRTPAGRASKAPAIPTGVARPPSAPPEEANPSGQAELPEETPTPDLWDLLLELPYLLDLP